MQRCPGLGQRPHLLWVSPRGVRGERPWLLESPRDARWRWKSNSRAWLGLSAACAAVVEHLLSEPPRRMNSARKGPMSRDRPQAAAERSEDRVRTVAKPAALDSGPSALCVGQEAASNAEATRTGRRHLHATHAQRRRGGMPTRPRRSARLHPNVRNRRTPKRAAWPVTAVQARPLRAPAPSPAVTCPPPTIAHVGARRRRCARRVRVAQKQATASGATVAPGEGWRDSAAEPTVRNQSRQQPRTSYFLGTQQDEAQRRQTERTEKGRRQPRASPIGL